MYLCSCALLILFVLFHALFHQTIDYGDHNAIFGQIESPGRWHKRYFLCKDGRHYPSRPLYAWTRHGYICYILPQKDITIYMDVQLNPGPIRSFESCRNILGQTSALHGQNCYRNADITTAAATGQQRHVYDNILLQLSHLPANGLCFYNSRILTEAALGWSYVCKTNRSYRGKRSGKKVKQREASKYFNIQAICNSPMVQRSRKFAYNSTRNYCYNNLVQIPLESNVSNCGPRLRFAVWNARSIKNKITSLCDLIISERVDILALTETWLTGSDSFVIADLTNTLQDHDIYHLPRTNRGGGVAVIVRRGLAIKQTESCIFHLLSILI